MTTDACERAIVVVLAVLCANAILASLAFTAWLWWVDDPLGLWDIFNAE